MSASIYQPDHTHEAAFGDTAFDDETTVGEVSEAPTYRRPRRTRFVALVLMLTFGMSATTGYAMLPGESAAIIAAIWATHASSEISKQGISAKEEFSKYQQWFDKLLVIKDQLTQLRANQRYFEQSVVGAWRDPLRVLRDERTRIVALGRDYRTIGWQVGGTRDEVTRSAAMTAAREAITRIDEIVKDGGSADGRVLRASLEDLYEVAQPTSVGGRSEAAMRDMAETIQFLGESKESIKQQLQVIEEANQMAAQGGLPDHEIQRLSVVTQSATARAQALQIQAQMYNTRLLLNQLGYTVADANVRERERLEERHNRVGVMNALKFTPGSQTVGQLDRQHGIE